MLGMAAVLLVATAAVLFVRWGTRKADDEAFLLSLRIGTDDPVTTVHFEYALAGTPTGGGTVENADGELLCPGDIVSRDFIPRDFPRNADLSTFCFTVLVGQPDGSEIEVNSPIKIDADYGSQYDYVLTGSAVEGYKIDYDKR